jgi:hypothetical protein
MEKLHYRVRFDHRGERRYGVVDNYSQDAKEVMADEKFLVNDAILPKSWVVKESDIIDVPFAKDHKEDEFDNYVTREMNKALEISKNINGCAVGKILRFSVADGYAFYIVVKLTKRLAHLEWRGFCLDRYTESVLGYEGTISRERCEILVGTEESFEKLFR